MTLGRGATVVRQSIVDYLESTIPTLIVTARDDWDLDEWQLPLPVSYKEVEPYALDKFPSLGVSVTSAGNFNRTDYTMRLEEKYLVTYSVRLFTWVRTPLDSAELPLKPEYEETIRLRDDMAALIRAALLLSPTLNEAVVMWDEDTLSEEYSEATPVKGDRFVAGVIHDFDIQIDESLHRAILGEADTIEVVTSEELAPLLGE
jgi:hypothetical protein